MDYEGEVEDASAEYKYVGTCFLVVAVSRTYCLGLMRAHLCSICAVAATAKTRTTQRCLPVSLSVRRNVPPLGPFSLAAHLQEEDLDDLVAVFHGVGCCLLTPDVFLC